MQVTEEKNQIVIRLDKNKVPTVSPSGKTLQVASSHGNTPTSVQVNGSPLIVGVNAFIKNPDYVKPAK
ncbi:hypothetical protein LCGC14_0814800 [marine sediment metagenome]|uniref:Uncharacterized protein n=1 Tax=marine sediment metagenome TaxID=412755 RepID=A0A0F9S5I2_9ZZZZ